jgi:hypothetical protein
MIDKHISRLKIIGEHEIAEYLEKMHQELATAIDDMHGLCHVCKHNNTKACDNCIQTPRIFDSSGEYDNWEWRGKRNG